MPDDQAPHIPPMNHLRIDRVELSNVEERVAEIHHLFSKTAQTLGRLIALIRSAPDASSVAIQLEYAGGRGMMDLHDLTGRLAFQVELGGMSSQTTYNPKSEPQYGDAPDTP